MKDKDYNMLQEAYTQVSENLYGNPQPKFIEMEDGRQMRDLEDLDKQALFMYVMKNPKLKEELNYLIGTGSMSEVSKWIETLEKSQNVISNGLQKSYLFDAAQESLFAKNPRAKEEHEALKARLNQEARKWDYEPWAGEQGDIEREWHGLSAKTPEPINPVELLKGASKMKSEDIPEPSIQDAIPEMSEILGDYNVNSSEEFAKLACDVLVDVFGSHNLKKFSDAIATIANKIKTK